MQTFGMGYVGMSRLIFYDCWEYNLFFFSYWKLEVINNIIKMQHHTIIIIGNSCKNNDSKSIITKVATFFI